MADKSVKILSKNVNLCKLLGMLNAALSEEWIAYYQYWIGAQIAVGAMRKEIQAELLEHAEDEAKHAQWICDRIIELNGIPEVMNPRDWDKMARCKFKEPSDPNTKVLLQQNLEGENCAIERYQEIADYTKDGDYVTCELAKKILAEEVEHAQDLTDYINDIKLQ